MLTPDGTDLNSYGKRLKMIRDFSETGKTELICLIGQAGLGSSSQDTKYQLSFSPDEALVYSSGWAGLPQVTACLDSLRAYEGLLVEKCSAAAAAAKQIFESVQQTEAQYHCIFKDLSDQLENENLYICGLRNIISSVGETCSDTGVENGFRLTGTQASFSQEMFMGAVLSSEAETVNYTAKLSSDNSQVYIGKSETVWASGITGMTDFGPYNLVPSVFVDGSAGVCAASAAWTQGDENAFVCVNAKAASADAVLKAAAGLYAYNDSGQFFSPCISAKAGAGALAAQMSAQGRVSNDYIGIYAKGEVKALEAVSQIEFGAVVFDQEGQYNPQILAKAAAQAKAAEISGGLGLVILGADVGVKAGMNVGIGAHAEFEYTDGVLSMDVGASLGIGVSFGLDIDIEGLLEGVRALTADAWSAISSAFTSGWDWTPASWDSFLSGSLE